MIYHLIYDRPNNQYVITDNPLECPLVTQDCERVFAADNHLELENCAGFLIKKLETLQIVSKKDVVSNHTIKRGLVQMFIRLKPTFDEEEIISLYSKGLLYKHIQL